MNVLLNLSFEFRSNKNLILQQKILELDCFFKIKKIIVLSGNFNLIDKSNPTYSSTS
jgi:hypothetical protein